MTTNDEEKSDGVTVGKTRRVVFTALGVMSFTGLALFVYYDAFGRVALSKQSPTGWIRSIASPGNTWWVVLSLSIIPIALLFASGHNSPSTVIKDRVLILATILITGTVAASAWLGDHNAMLTGENGRISPSCIAVPLTLTIAFIIASAMRRAIRDAAQFAAGEEE